MNRLPNRPRPLSTRHFPQLVFHIQEPECNGYDFHYHLQEQAEYLIGRAALRLHPFDGIRILLQDPEVSLQHARIFLHDKGFWMIEDLESAKGTFLRPSGLPREMWQNLAHPSPLVESTDIRVGRTLLTVRYLDAEGRLHPRTFRQPAHQQVTA
ncbi:MAG: FHA domain-containing protein [Magnetococcus sp. YQC-9]